MILCVAAESVVVLNVVVPPDKVPVPSVVDPSLNVTVPVVVLGDTVAVKVTDWPNVEGLVAEVTVVVVGDLPPLALANIVGLSIMKIVPTIITNKRLREKILLNIFR